MKIWLGALTCVLGAALAANAQESGEGARPLLTLYESPALEPAPPESEAGASARPAQGDVAPKLAFGVHLGYFEAKDADDGEVFYGLHARIYLLKHLAAEGSLDIARSDFQDDDAELTFIPIQVTGLVFPLPDLQIRPYGLLGLGWYFTDVDYSGSLSGLSDEDESVFGFHIGFGGEMQLGRVLMLHADVRYILLDEPDLDAASVDSDDLDYVQIMIGLSVAL